MCCCLPSDSDQKMLAFPFLAQTIDLWPLWKQEGETEYRIYRWVLSSGANKSTRSKDYVAIRFMTL